MAEERSLRIGSVMRTLFLIVLNCNYLKYICTYCNNVLNICVHLNIESNEAKIKRQKMKRNGNHIEAQFAKQKSATSHEAKQKAFFFNECVNYISSFMKSEDDFDVILKDLWAISEKHSYQLGALITSMEFAVLIIEALEAVYDLSSTNIRETDIISKHVVDYTNVLRKTGYNPFFPNKQAYDLGLKIAVQNA
jgi:hypothetical protein